MLARAALIFSLLTAAGANWESAGKAWWAHVRYLADDKLQGRAVGTPGFEMAADYVANQFHRAGLDPAVRGSYSQPVGFIESKLNEPASEMTLITAGAATPAELGETVLITSQTSVDKIEAPLVFAGYGLDIPEAGYSDLKDPALRGAIAVYLSGGPANISSDLRSHHASGGERAAAMRAAGVLGTIQIPNPRSMDIPWARQIANHLLPRMMLAESGAPLLQFTANWNPAEADRLFGGSGHTMAEILDAADHDRPLPHFGLTAKMRVHVATTHQNVFSRNIVGIRAGSDNALMNECVILSAHLDHLGVGGKVNGDGIFNGAMDNAAGVASLIEIARALKAGKVKTKRSIVFLAVTAEEKGELGSQYFASHPATPGRIVADINMDMYLPLFPLKYLEVQGLNESTLGDEIRMAANAAHVEVQADKDPDANRFIRSDQYSFIRKGVPALAFKFGWIPGSPEEKIFRDWYRERYHAVGDDASQPVDTEAAAQFNAILAALLERIADAPQAPQWKPESFFRRFAQ
jgi:hypothetical protein